MKQVAGAAILALAFSWPLAAIAWAEGWKVALGTATFSVSVTGLVVLGAWMVTS